MSETFTVHMSQSIRGPLLNWGPREWAKATKYLLKPDGSAFGSWMELKRAFLDELAKGHEVVPIGDCPDFDFKKGCPGHPMPKEAV